MKKHEAQDPSIWGSQLKNENIRIAWDKAGRNQDWSLNVGAEAFGEQVMMALAWEWVGIYWTWCPPLSLPANL